MEKTNSGAWIIHHSSKLEQVTTKQGFENLYLAGRCGVLLSALSESSESTLNKEKVKVIAEALGISVKVELPSLIAQLKEKRLINESAEGNIAVLGITSTNLLIHTDDIFAENDPLKSEQASIELSEKISEAPLPSNFVSEYIGDTYKMSTTDVKDFLEQVESIGFVDSEEIDNNKKLYFNGNLFRKQVTAGKINAVLSSLKQEEMKNVNEVSMLLDSTGCQTLEKIISILGRPLFEKLQSIGMYDVNTISNENEHDSHFVTKPGAFAKYGNPFIEDALDLAKAFVASLSYGMNKSSYERGQIRLLKLLLEKLIRGEWVGPAPAIGRDYTVLEFKKVVEIKRSAQSSSRFYMRLLKKEIGEIALRVLSSGQGSEAVLLTGASFENYVSPERNRVMTRKKQNTRSKKDVMEALRTLRTN